MANDFTADEYVNVTKALSAITELVLFDRFWTDGAKAATGGDPGARDPDRLQGLESVSVEIERLLVEVELRARGVAAMGRRRATQLEANFATLSGENSLLTPRQRERMVELVNSRTQGDLSAFVDAAAADVAAQLEPERTLLKTELDRIKKGRPTNGDLSDDEERALAELAVLATIAVGPVGGVVVEAVGHILDFFFG